MFDLGPSYLVTPIFALLYLGVYVLYIRVIQELFYKHPLKQRILLAVVWPLIIILGIVGL